MTMIENKAECACRFAHTAARVIIASYFLAKGVGVIADPSGMTGFLEMNGVPDYLRWPNQAFEIVSALAIMLGFQTRMAAALMAIYLFWSSFILNYIPGDPVALGAFWRDLALIGGLLLLFSHGRGSFALDNMLTHGPRPAADPADADGHAPKAIVPAEEAA